MKLPNLRLAFVPEEKIKRYLLNADHQEGRGKADFFLYFGFSVAKWTILAHELIDHARNHEVVKEETTRFGVRYVIEGPIQTPIGRNVELRTVWFIRNGDYIPRLVTAYPLEESND